MVGTRSKFLALVTAFDAVNCFHRILFHRMSVIKSRVENRRSGFSLPVATDETFASSPQSGLA